MISTKEVVVYVFMWCVYEQVGGYYIEQSEHLQASEWTNEKAVTKDTGAEQYYIFFNTNTNISNDKTISGNKADQ